MRPTRPSSRRSSRHSVRPSTGRCSMSAPAPGACCRCSASDVERAVGFDNSHSMLAVARANLERAEIRRVDLRQGDVYSPPFAKDSFDLIVIHQVLHFLDDPARAVREAARLLSPGGRLLIVDFAPHSLEFLRTEHAHRRLGFRTDTVERLARTGGTRGRRRSKRSSRPRSTAEKPPRANGSPCRCGSVEIVAMPVAPTRPSERLRRMTLSISFEVFPPKSTDGLDGLRTTVVSTGRRRAVVRVGHLRCRRVRPPTLVRGDRRGAIHRVRRRRLTSRASASHGPTSTR